MKEKPPFDFNMWSQNSPKTGITSFWWDYNIATTIAHFLEANGVMTLVSPPLFQNEKEDWLMKKMLGKGDYLIIVIGPWAADIFAKNDLISFISVLKKNGVTIIPVFIEPFLIPSIFNSDQCYNLFVEPKEKMNAILRQIVL